MSKRKYVAVGLTLTIIVLSATILYVGSSIQQISVTFVGMLPELSETKVIVLVRLSIHNPSYLASEITELPFTVWLANHLLGHGRVITPFYIRSKSTMYVESKIYIDYQDIPSIALSVIRQQLEEGQLTYRVSGTVTTRLFFNAIIPFEIKGTYP